MGQSCTLRKHLLGAAAFSVIAALATGTASADPAEGPSAFRLEAMPLGDALRQFSAQSGIPILFSEADVAGPHGSQPCRASTHLPPHWPGS